MPVVSIHGTDKTFEVNEGEILYDSLADRGETLPHGCLSGSCGACRVAVISGKDNLQKVGVIEQNTIDALKEEFEKTKGVNYVCETVIRLSCRAKVLGNVVVSPIK